MKIVNIKINLILVTLFVTLISCKDVNSQSEKDQDRKVKKIEYINKENNTIERTEFFDKKGNKTKEISHSIEYGDSETTYLYNKRNELIEEKEFNSKGKLKKTKYYKFKAISDQEFFEYTYEKRDDGEKKMIKETKLENNDDGFLSKSFKRTVYGNWEYNYKYHSNHKLKEEIILAYNNTEKVVKTYNLKGKPIKEIIFRRKTDKDKFKLERTNYWYYDDKGNETTKDGKLKVINSPYKLKTIYY